MRLLGAALEEQEGCTRWQRERAIRDGQVSDECAGRTPTQGTGRGQEALFSTRCTLRGRVGDGDSERGPGACRKDCRRKVRAGIDVDLFALVDPFVPPLLLPLTTRRPARLEPRASTVPTSRYARLSVLMLMPYRSRSSPLGCGLEPLLDLGPGDGPPVRVDKEGPVGAQAARLRWNSRIHQ